MSDMELIGRAQSALLEAESHGFLHTAEALRSELERLLTPYPQMNFASQSLNFGASADVAAPRERS